MKSRRKMPTGWVPHDELWELYNLDVKRHDVVNIPAIPMTEKTRIKGYKRLVKKGEEGMKEGRDALVAFAEKLEDEGLKDELVGLIEGLEVAPEEASSQEGGDSSVAATLASMNEAIGALSARFDELATPPAPEAEASEENVAEEEPAPLQMTQEELQEAAETVEVLTEAAENGQLDEEGVQTLVDLSEMLETQTAVHQPSA